MVAARYSTLAGWSFALVAVSGLVNAYLRLGGLRLTRTYGLLVIGKATALIVLGTAGWLHRRATIPGARRRPAKSHWFARLASAEILVMAATMGLAVALSRSAPPVEPVVADPATSLLGYPPPPPISVATWLTQRLPVDALADDLRADDRPVRGRGGQAPPRRQRLARAPDGAVAAGRVCCWPS